MNYFFFIVYIHKKLSGVIIDLFNSTRMKTAYSLKFIFFLSLASDYLWMNLVRKIIGIFLTVDRRRNFIHLKFTSTTKRDHVYSIIICGKKEFFSEVNEKPYCHPYKFLQID